MLFLHEPTGRSLELSLLLGLLCSIALLLILVLCLDDLIRHFWGQVHVLDTVAVWASELLPFSKLRQDLGWDCIYQKLVTQIGAVQ